MLKNQNEPVKCLSMLMRCFIYSYQDFDKVFFCSLLKREAHHFKKWSFKLVTTKIGNPLKPPETTDNLLETIRNHSKLPKLATISPHHGNPHHYPTAQRAANSYFVFLRLNYFYYYYLFF